ncbi:hypothetical protein GCM10009416_00730 [Craurococcus roseus]|uniref:Uncharacterized protein n=1 Tax=Craurococcus roseus TaxID=77585 RepID=A0ABN1EHB7_9PROT
MSAAGRWIARRVAAGLLVVAALLAAVTLVPLRVYKPSCGDPPRSIVGARPRMEGPLRPEYVEMLTRAMREESFRYWRIGNTILAPLFPIFDGNRLFGNWTDFVNNTEWRIASSIVNGYTAHGCAPPPEAVRRLDEGIKGTCGVPRERLPDGRIVGPVGVDVSNDCTLFRAAVIRVEDMPRPLPALERPAVPREGWPGPAWTEPAPQRR